jgi:tetratricopeptide (TPR) repeat protein
LLLDERLRRLDIMRIPAGQSFVSRLLPPRDRVLAFSLPLLLLAACASPAEKAAEQAAIAQRLFDAGNLPAAKTYIGKALAYGGDDVDILLLDARIKTGLSDLRGAYDAYRTVLVFQPDNLEALASVAQIGVMVGEKDVARDAIRRSLAIEPANPQILLTAGVMELQDNDFAAAIALGDRILTNAPGDPRGLALKARALTQMGRGDEALTLLREQIALTGNNSMIAGALLETARAQGQPTVMIEQFPVLIEAMPQSVELALDEINVRYKAGDREGARFAARDFLGKFGAQADAMARLLDLWEEYDPAPLSADDMAQIAANGAIEARLAAARYYFDRGDLAAAQALVADSPDLRAAGLRARIQIRRGEPGGVQAAGRIIANDDTNCEALTAMAEWNLGQGKIDAAVIPAQVVAAQCRDRIDGYLILAQAYERANRAPAVERVSRDGIAAHPLDPRLTSRFADWLLKRGRGESAVAAARRLTTVAPSRESSWRVLASVCKRAGNSICAGDAARGLARVKTVYQLDPLPGVRPPDPLFGRTWR